MLMENDMTTEACLNSGKLKIILKLSEPHHEENIMQSCKQQRRRSAWRQHPHSLQQFY